MNLRRMAEDIQKSNWITFSTSGNSMRPVIQPKDIVTLVPMGVEDTRTGDIVLCKVKGRYYLHKVLGRDSKGRVKIGNNRGHINGWTRRVFGKVWRVTYGPNRFIEFPLKPEKLALVKDLIEAP